MEIVAWGELRENASDLVRRAEAGEEITITVDGRPAARLVPAAAHAWRRWTDVADLFSGPADPTFMTDRDGVAHNVVEPCICKEIN